MDFNQLYRLTQENLVRPINKSLWVHQLVKNGWHLLNGGAFANVYGHPDKDWVIKIYTSDPGYNMFLDFLETQQGNPCVVKIRRNIFRDPTRTHGSEAVALEKLKPIRNHFFFRMAAFFVNTFKHIDTTNQNFEEVLSEVVEEIRDAAQRSVTYSADPKSRWTKRQKYTLQFLDVFVKKFRPLIATIFQLHQFMKQKGTRYNFDLHNENFMIRPSTGQIVITDPLSYIDKS